MITKTRSIAVLIMAGILGSTFSGFIGGAEAAAPANFVTETVVSGLEVPTAMAFAPDGRIFVTEKAGKVRVIKNGVLLPTPFLDFSSKINQSGDRGMLGIAIDPSFSSNRYIYLSYTYENSPANPDGPKTGRVVRVKANGDVMQAGSEKILVGTVSGTTTTPSCNQYAVTADCIPSDSLSHSVGGLRFGPDGKLYASLGDGADFGTVDENARKALNVDSLAGKIIRINKDGTAPNSNPYYERRNTTSNRSKVWTYGHRNSFRFNFRPSNGALFFGEVGWFSFEEINVAQKGGNYGWPCREGMIATPGYNCTTTGAIDPIHTFAHIQGNSNAIIGGTFAGAAYPAAYQGDYFFGELGTGKIFRMKVNAQNQKTSVEDFLDGADGPVEFVTGPDGSIYYISIFTGSIRKLVYKTDLAPNAVASATPTTGAAPLTVALSATGSTDPESLPLSFAWNFGDGSATTTIATTTSHIYAQNGIYTATLTVRDPAGNTDTDTVRITVGNQTGNADPAFVTATVTPATGPIGQVFGFNATLRNDGAADPFTARFEVRDTETNAKVFERKFENETLATGATKNYTFSFQYQQASIYKLVVVLESIDGATVFETVDPALTFDMFERQPDTPFAPALGTVSATPTAPYATSTPVTATLTVNNTGGNGIADVLIEIYRDENGTNVPVATQTFPNESFASGHSKQFAATFTPTVAGAYYFDAGIFSPGGATMYGWGWRMRAFEVGSGSGNPDPDPEPAPLATIFKDTTGTGWGNWSWATQTTAVSTPVTEGTTALSVTYQDPYGGLFFHHDTFATNGYTNITFKLNGGTAGGQVLHVFATDEAASHPSVVLANYGGAPEADTWKTYTIPLSDLTALNTSVNGFAIMGGMGVIESPYFIDPIELQ